MENKNVVVSGEASESDIEDETVSKKPAKLYGTVVPGEASESDDELESSDNYKQRNTCKDEVENSEGEANDDDDEDSCSSASEAFMCRSLASAVPVNDSDTSVPHVATALKYNTLLHKKLCESNVSLEKGISELLNRPLIDATHKLNDINQHLLTSQVAIQNASNSVQKALNTFSKVDSLLSSVLSVQYLPEINIRVPPKNNTS